MSGDPRHDDEPSFGAVAQPLPAATLATLLSRLLVVLLALSLTASACTQRGEAGERPDLAEDGDVDGAEDQSAEEDDRVPVAAFPIGRGSIEQVLSYSTNLEAENQVEVLAEASRQVTELLVEEGDRVRKGQVLLRLESEEQATNLERIESQLARAEREYQRQKRLFDQELIPEQAFSDATYEKEQLEHARDDALRELSYATIRAPIAGVVTMRDVSLGDYVQPNSRLFDLVDFDSVVARVYVPERELARLEVGQAARLISPAFGDDGTRDARIQRIAPVVDAQSGTVKVTLEIRERQGMRPGMFVEADLVADRDDDALLVPKRALVLDDEQTFVYRVVRAEGTAGDDDRVQVSDPETGAAAEVESLTVERLQVSAQIEDRDWIKVDPLTSGLSDGDRLVVAGQAGLKEGVAVRLIDLEEAMTLLANERSE